MKILTICLLLSSACTDVNQDAFIAELNKSRVLVETTNIDKIEMFDDAVAYLKKCSSEPLADLDSGVLKLNKIFELKLKTQTEISETSPIESLKPLHVYSEDLQRALKYDHEKNELKSLIANDLEPLERNFENLSEPLRKAIMASMIERWTLKFTELTIKSFAIDPC